MSIAESSVIEPETVVNPGRQAQPPWETIVLNDPINLMTYVTYVFREYFGYSEAKAQRLMREVHDRGHSVVATGARELMERDTQAMHEYGLWAQCRQGGSAA